MKTKIVANNYIGKRFGRLVITSLSHKSVRNENYFLCKCDCGNFTTASQGNLRAGNVISCKCYRKEKFTLPDGESAFNRLLRNYKRKAKDRNYLWDLSSDEVRMFSKQNCHYCNKAPLNICKSEQNTGDYTYNGIDRKDNTKGYTLGNCVTCCKDCNRAKSDMPYNEYIAYIKAQAEHLFGIKIEDKNG